MVEDVRELVGRTPLLRLRGLGLAPGTECYAKLEMFNPGGSVKDRIGVHMLERAEAAGLLRPGMTLIEPTAGNTGIGLALAARGRGYRVIFVVPRKFSVEKQLLMRALGAEIVHTPTEEGMVGAMRRARELAAEIGDAYIPQQFENSWNPEAHYLTTGPEIWEQMGGRIDLFVAGAGTGGTFTGCARYLKERNPRLKAVVVEPVGSVLGGGPPGPHRTEGIGVEEITPTLDMSLADEVETIPDDEAFAMVERLALEAGVLAGSSSGAALAAVVRQSHKWTGPRPLRVATIFPDSSERYLSQGIYSFEEAVER
ncbi:MAG: cysteine synthase family protein [Firmicutes bacterium]|nr:cysteine synthase family protein [Bacillota bacterium]